MHLPKTYTSADLAAIREAPWCTRVHQILIDAKLKSGEWQVIDPAQTETLPQGAKA